MKFYKSVYDYLDLESEGSRSLGSGYDLIETKDNFKAIFLAPGVLKDSISLTLSENILKIVGSYESSYSDESCLHKGLPNLSFEKEFSLGRGISLGEIKASLDNGLLTIILPKSKNYSKSIPIT